jgi:hypothetical protein
MARLGFVGPAYALSNRDAAAQRCVNLFPQALEVGNEPSQVILRGTPGLKSFATIVAGQPMRGAVSGGSVLYTVCGTGFYEVSTAGSATLRGTLNTSEGICSLAFNGTQVLIVDGTNGYVWDVSGATFSLLGGADFLGGDVVGFLDGYFIVNQPDTQYFQISSLYDGSTWDALDFGAAEGQPDNLVSLSVVKGQLWLFGETTTEVFYNSGNADFPFERVPGSVSEKGCAAKHSPAKIKDSVCWLGNDRVIYRSNGYGLVKISTHAIDEAIAGYSVVSDAVGMSYEQEGHDFYALTFPTAGVTWVYDAVTNLWHERGGFNGDTGVFLRWRPNFLVYWNDTVVAGDYSNGKLYTLDLATYTDNGETIVRMRRTPHAKNAMKRIFHSEVMVQFETGVNGMTPAIPMPEPQAMLRWSDDGGWTWSNELWRSLGAQGEYGLKVNWNRLGAGRNRIYELRVTDAARLCIIDDDITVSAGAS